MTTTAKKMAAQVGEMLCVSPETGKKLGIWAVSPDGTIGLGTADGSEFWILESMLHESSEIEVKGLATRSIPDKKDLGNVETQLATATEALHRIANSDIIRWDADTQEEYERDFLPWAQKIARAALGQSCSKCNGDGYVVKIVRGPHSQAGVAEDCECQSPENVPAPAPAESNPKQP